MFHLIEFKGTGGASLFVDGFQVAAQLQRLDPPAYTMLSTVRIPSHCAGDDDNFIQPTPSSFPLLNHDPLDGELYQIRYNNNDRSTIRHVNPGLVRPFYHALGAWNALVEDPRNEYWT